MIREIGVEVRAYLASQGCPVAVVDGPEPSNTTTFARERIVCERIVDAGEAVVAAPSQRRNPRMVAARRIGGRLTVYAQEPKAGALEFEHIRRVDRIVDMVLVGLEKSLTARKTPFELGPGKLVLPGDLKASASQSGAVYEIQFSFLRAVEVVTWAGSEPTEVQMGGLTGVVLTSSTHAARQGDETATTETACGV